MSESILLIQKKIEHLKRMRVYLDYSLEQTLLLMPISDWSQLTPQNHQTLRKGAWPLFPASPA